MSWKKNAIWPLLLLSCKTSNPSSELRSDKDQGPILGLNDVAILIPHTFDVGFAAKVPSPFDKPDPARFAPGAQALPLDGKAFIPSEVLKGLADELAKDSAILTRDQRFKLGYEATKEMLEKDAAIADLDKDASQKFRLIAMRIDPCSNYAVLKAITPACQHEVRITWQKVELGKYFSAKPQSFHAMHHLDDVSFERFVNGLRSLRSKAGPSDPEEQLAPHPVIRKEGPGSPYLSGLMGLVHRYIRATNLVAVSLHHESASQDDDPWFKHWSMTAVGVKNGLPYHVDLPLLKDQNPKRFAQRHALDREQKWRAPWRTNEEAWAQASGMWDDRVHPSPAWTAKGSLFQEPSRDEGPIIEHYKNSWIIQNPLTHTRLNTDCATCHMAAHHQDKNENLIHGLASKTKAEREEILKRPVGTFTSKTWNTEAAYLDRGFFGESRSGSSDSLQMFGYLGADWIVMRHVNNDAALSADLIKDF